MGPAHNTRDLRVLVRFWPCLAFRYSFTASPTSNRKTRRSCDSSSFSRRRLIVESFRQWQPGEFVSSNGNV